MTGNSVDGQGAANWAAGFTLDDVGGTASDQARWNGEAVIVVFDWCYPLFSAAQRSAMLSRWNSYITTLDAKEWGGPGMETSNYYWGYLRNAFEWALATYGEQPTQAKTYLDEALVRRWQHGVMPWAASTGKGGVFSEGSQYGRYMAGYAVIPWATAEALGRDILRETNFYREGLMWLIAQTTPAPTSGAYRIHAFSDDENSQAANDNYWGDFVALMAVTFAGTALAGWARQWLATVQPPVDPFMASILVSGATKPFSDLPLDYFAPGLGFWYARDRWAADATYVQVQSAMDTHGGHTHGDAGNFHLWRKGVWLSKESTEYSVNITGWGGSGSVGIDQGPAHNVPFVNGKGPQHDYSQNAARTLRLASTPDVAYLATDLTSAWRASDSRFNVPEAVSVVREFVFLRQLGVLIVLDRIQTPNASTKVGVAIHSDTVLSLVGQTANTVNGAQALGIVINAESPVALRAVNEGSKGHYRLEVETSGQTVTHLVSVLTPRDANALVVPVSVINTPTQLTVTIGSAVVVFQRGAGSSGGSVNGVPLPETVASVSVDDNGVHWS